MRCTPTFGLLPLFYFCLAFSPLTAVWDRVVAHHALVIATGVVTSAPSRRLSPVPVCTGCCVNLLRGTEEDEEKTDRQISYKRSRNCVDCFAILCLCRIAAGEDKSHGAAEFILV